jgi:hypothetical protein
VVIVAGTVFEVCNSVVLYVFGKQLMYAVELHPLKNIYRGVEEKTSTQSYAEEKDV